MPSATELKNRANNKLVSSRSFSSNKNLYTYFPHNMCNLMLYVAEECECEKNIIYLDSTMIQWNEVNGTRKDVLINICHVIYDTKLYCRECGGRSFLYISFFSFHLNINIIRFSEHQMLPKIMRVFTLSLKQLIWLGTQKSFKNSNFLY